MDEERKLISAKEAANILGLKNSSGVYHHLQKGHIEGVLVPAKTRRRFKYYEDSVFRYKNVREGNSSAYGNIDIAMDEVCKPLLSIKYQSPNAPFYYPQKQYLVTSYGYVWDLSNNTKLSAYRCGNGHYQITILFRGKPTQVLLHRIIAMMFCPNGNFKIFVHHIDCDKANNRAENLIWVTLQEHRALHSLWNECKERNDYADYYQKVDEIKRGNIIRKPYRYIEERNDGNGLVYLAVTEKAYKRIASGESTDTLMADEILSECYVNIAQALKRLSDAPESDFKPLL